MTEVPDDFDFGQQIVGGTLNSTYTLTNGGGVDAVIDETLTNSLIAPFQFEGGTYPGTSGTCTTTNLSGDLVIAPSESCTIVVSFSPIAVGNFSDDLELAYNDGLNSQLEVLAIEGEGTGAGLLEISNDPEYDFGTIARNDTAYATLTITNTGTSPATGMTDITLAAPFSYQGGFPGTDGTIPGTCSGSLAGFGNSCTIIVPVSYTHLTLPTICSV